MNTKEKVKNDIIVRMNNHLTVEQLTVLEAVLVTSFNGIVMEQEETSLATLDTTNDYIINLFMIKKASKLAEKTVEAYLLTLRELIALTGKSLLKMNQNDIEYYLYTKKQTGKNCNTTLNNQLLNISAFFTWMRKSKLIPDNPCEGIESYPTALKPIEYFTVIEMEQIRSACRTPRQRAMVELLRSTAVRRGEVPFIKVGDIDFASGKVQVYGQKTRTYRTVYLDEVAKKYIQDYLKQKKEVKPEDQLFTVVHSKTAREFNGRDVYDLIHRLSKKMGMKKLRPHVFRKTTATNICRRGGSEELAGIYLGHAPRSVTGRHYTYRSEMCTEEIFKKYVEAV